MAVELWGTDAPVSLPVVAKPELPIVVDLGGSGFGFTMGGIAHTVNANQLEELLSPSFAPPMTGVVD